MKIISIDLLDGRGAFSVIMNDDDTPYLLNLMAEWESDLAEAEAAEREACAVLCEKLISNQDNNGAFFAAAIRDRGRE